MSDSEHLRDQADSLFRHACAGFTSASRSFFHDGITFTIAGRPTFVITALTLAGADSGSLSLQFGAASSLATCFSNSSTICSRTLYAGADSTVSINATDLYPFAFRESDFLANRTRGLAIGRNSACVSATTRLDTTLTLV